jgi:hypothetical protein
VRDACVPLKAAGGSSKRGCSLGMGKVPAAVSGSLSAMKWGTTFREANVLPRETDSWRAWEAIGRGERWPRRALRENDGFFGVGDPGLRSWGTSFPRAIIWRSFRPLSQWLKVGFGRWCAVGDGENSGGFPAERVWARRSLGPTVYDEPHVVFIHAAGRVFSGLAGFLASFCGFSAFSISSQTLQSLQSGVEMRARFVRERAHAKSK